ncbi:MAG: molybdate ABC transporter permease subunit, partial [Gammaproteobacteria bacterium]|nr:molybdate ABC transporter permease subunit [Gammaproteobacteria bacterium]
HTLGEFGVVLMVGGNIPGETKTVAISIYDRTQAFDLAGANAMSLLLLAISLTTIVVSYGLVGRMMNARRPV